MIALPRTFLPLLLLFFSVGDSSSAGGEQYVIVKRHNIGKAMFRDKMSEKQIRAAYEALIEKDQQSRARQERDPGFRGLYVWEEINLVVKDPLLGPPTIKIDFTRYQDLEKGSDETLFQRSSRILLRWSCLYRLTRQ
ncbi:MAG: hypothetical protein WD342_07200 [Verrucomicrobiales bacterium]